MTILNKDTLYYLATWNKDVPFKQVRNDLLIWPEYEASTDLYYGIEFMSDIAFDIFPLDTLLNATQLDHIRNGGATLVLSNTHEAFHYILEGLYDKIVIRYNIPPANIILISESADIKTAVEDVSNRLGLAPMKTSWSRRFEFDVQQARYWSDNTIPFEQQLGQFPFKPMNYLGEFPNTLRNKHYDKKYLCFNRRWRPHRPLLVALLCAYDMLSDGYVSLGKSDDNRNWQSVYPQISSLTMNNETISQVLRDYEDQIKSLPSLYLDNEDLVTNKADLLGSAHQYYADTYFSVVTETNFFTTGHIDTGRFISEKTFKPIVYRHPFIAVTVPHFLDKLREIGYRTFSPYINEDYDLELDDSARILKIVKEIDRLSKLSPEELTVFLDGVREICEFNYHKLMSTTKFTTDL